MDRWYGLVLFVFLVLDSTSAFNFAPEFAKVISDPSGDTTSLFGYAVALRKQSDPTGSVPGILVGAPLGNIDHPDMRSVYRPGNIYWCPQAGKQPCKESLLDIAPSHVLEGIRSNRSLSYLGSSLDTLDFGNGFAVCAPRWRNEPLRIVSNMNGMCYWEENVTSPEEDENRIFTLYETEYQALKDEDQTIFYGYGEAGFSVAVNQNGGEILIGAPGVFKWKGAILRYNISAFDLQKPVPQSVYPDSITNESYFGYSVGYGDFPESNHTVYIGGAPRGGELKGKVFMFDFVKNNDVWEYSILKEWQGTQIGEYFGSSVVIADFNQDGLDDLLVGAPQYSLVSKSMSNAMGDEGCVYMFITDKETGWKKTGEPNRLMGLKQHGARFGYAISVLGDINMDSYPDVAIGAPYEDDSRGVVYLYLGSKDGLNLEYSQRLVAQEIDSNLRGFGSSISRGFDVDENYYNDLAIGAYPSNNVVLVKTYPIVTMEPEFIPSVSKIGFNDTEFNASACVTYSGRHAPSKIDVAITVRADPLYKRAHFLSGGKEFSYNVTLEYGGDRDCRNFTFVIGGLKEHYKPFDISMDYKLHSQKKRASDTSESFCKDCPVLNETKVHWWKVPYGLGCKEDTSCSIDLDMKASFMNVRSPFVIGTEEFVSFQMELENKNDPAYLSKISIIFPRATQHRRLPVDCRENGTAEFKNHLVQLVCDVDGPLNQGNKYNLTLELDMKNVPLSMHQLEINVTAISSDVDSDESNNHVQLILPLQADFNVAVNGLSVPEQFAFASRKKDSDVEVIQDKDFTHTFQINNKGPTPVNSLSLDFKIPYSVYIGKKFVDILDVSLPLVEMQRQHLFCKVDKHSDVVQEGVVRSLPNRQAAEIEDVSSNRTLLLDCSLKHVRCVDVKCVMDRQFVKKTSVIVSFPIKTKLQQSESLIVNKDRVIATSSCLARLTETEIREKMVQITMWRAFPDTGVAWWIYFLAILAGILVLAGIIWCCYKRGFFRRDMHMQLQAMKQPSLVEQEFLSENSDT